MKREQIDWLEHVSLSNLKWFSHVFEWPNTSLGNFLSSDSKALKIDLIRESTSWAGILWTSVYLGQES